jgi:peroxiredoxin
MNRNRTLRFFQRVTIAAISAFGAMAIQAGGFARGQERATKPAQAPAAEGVEGINREFQRELIQLERRRLQRLAELAARQPKAEAQKTYEVYLSSAASRDLFADAEPIAEKILKDGDAPPRLLYLAQANKIIAQVRNGDFEGSLSSVRAACQSSRELGRDGQAPPPLPLAERLALVEVYYQSLVQADQFDVARKALAMIRDVTREDSVKDYLDGRLARLAMIGRPAPAIDGTDLDGQPFRLSNDQGKVVLLVFWASWNLPGGREADRLAELERTYRDRGFRVVGVNLDALQEGVAGADAVLPQVRRFVIDHNITWPNLVDGRAGAAYAKAYGVREIPANFLIGRDGHLLHLDLAPPNIERVIARSLRR